MKPKWEDAPEWANYLAMNKDGKWVWFENEPEIGDKFYGNEGEWDFGGKKQELETTINWEKTLVRRS